MSGSNSPERSRPESPPTACAESDHPLDQVDVDRLMVFVPAIMSVGLLFSFATLLQDLLRWLGGRARTRRTAIAAGSVLSQLLDEEEEARREIGVLARPAYLLTAVVLVGGALYIAVGSTANFLRDGGYVRDIGWLLSLSLALAVVLGFLGGVSFVVFWTWPRPPPWTLGPLRTAPLTVTPGLQGMRPSWAVGAGLVLSAVATGIVTLIVASGRSVAREIDEPIARWLVEARWIDQLEPIDPFGRTIISILLVVCIGLSAFRCRVMAVVYPAAFLVSWLSAGAIREVVERPRPTIHGDFESFPSGHMVQAVFVAGLVPLAIWILFRSRRAEIVSRVVLIAGVVATGLHRIHAQHHWPLDSLAGVTLGVFVVLGVYWAVQHRSWHRHCPSCPWSGASPDR